MLAFALSPFLLNAQSAKNQTFPLNRVTLLNSPFLDAEKTDLKYMLQLEPDRLLAPFLREAGLTPKAESYGNWENTGLDGHTCGHYLTALAQMYAATGSVECKKRLDYMVGELARCQKATGDGYVGGVPGGRKMWAQVKKGDFSDFNKKWVPWYNLHKLFAGLRDAWQLENNQQAKEVFISLTDWADDELSDLTEHQVQSMLNMEHGGMNEVIADAYALTGDPKYLRLAIKFSHRALLDPLARHEDKLTGLHANTQIPKVVGFERIAELNGDTAFASAARYFWQNVVEKRTISIGGNSVAEHFNPVNDFSSMLESEQGPETCNSNNMLKLTKMLFLDDDKQKYIEFYERLLYNHILSSQRPVTGGFVYFTPIHPEHYRVYSTPRESFWCCVGTGMENHGKYGELIYTHKNNDLYINLFIPSKLDWKEKHLNLVQQNDLLSESKTSLTLKLYASKKFSMHIRQPEWVVKNGFKVMVNGKPVATKLSGDGYVAIDRVWHDHDRIVVNLPMKNEEDFLPGNSKWVSFVHGPYVLAAAADTNNMPGLMADGSRWGHIAGGKILPLTDAPVLLETPGGTDKTLYPVNGKPDEFELVNLVNTKRKQVLRPFYQVHDTRYMLYWPVSARDSITQEEKNLATLDEIYLKLAPRTVDQVSPGEQQPENDHQLQAEDSETGVTGNKHWRSSGSRFSYRMRHTSQAKFLRISYLVPRSGCDFDVLVNEEKVAHIVADKPANSNDSVSAEYALPGAGQVTDERFVVEFVAAKGSKTAQVTDVRILKK